MTPKENGRRGGPLRGTVKRVFPASGVKSRKNLRALVPNWNSDNRNQERRMERGRPAPALLIVGPLPFGGFEQHDGAEGRRGTPALHASVLISHGKLPIGR